MIIDRINEDMKISLKDGNKEKLGVLRMVKTALVNAKISKNHDLSNDEMIQVLRSQVKQRNDSVEEYTKYNKMDKVEELKNEINIIKEYLPAELSEDEINAKLDIIFDEVKPTSIKEMGLLMKKCDEVFGSSVDKGHLSKLIKDRFDFDNKLLISR